MATLIIKLKMRSAGRVHFQLILSTYYNQNDDARLVAEAEKIDFGLGLPKTA